MRSKLTKFALAATFGLALAFTFSCTSDDVEDNPIVILDDSSSSSDNPSSSSDVPSSSSHTPSSGSDNPSSSSDNPSSSSHTPSSSSGGQPSVSSSSSSQVIAPVYGESVTDVRDGQIYETVVIGQQVWMARNLNFETENSKCYDNDPANCDIYGRLYSWVTAMALPSSCNSNSCNSQIYAEHKGICPSGWHIPSDVEWRALMQYVDPSCSTNQQCSNAATKLKATSGWRSGNGTDDYGFSALPGGTSSGNVGTAATWWTTKEENANSVYYQTMSVDWTSMYFNPKSFSSISVRCIQNGNNNPSSSSGGQPSVSSSSSSGGNVPSLFADKGNDIANYRTTQIGDQVWMAENLNYDVAGSKCYGENGLVPNLETMAYDITLSDSEVQANCDKYGRLYSWATAMALPSSCNSSFCATSVKHKGICPSGWHIPSDAEWTTLTNFVGTFSANKLKTTSGWNPFGENMPGDGTDDYGFSALPGSGGDSQFSTVRFSGIGNYGYWWSASEYDANNAYERLMGHGNGDVFGNHSKKITLYSVRCVQD